MEISEEELEKKLLEAGNVLIAPPSSSSELLEYLEMVENLLGGVEQSPSESMKEALVPSTKALIAEDLLRHSNADVKVAVASCISEITRITAPDAPYADDQMKEVFQLIVSSFEKLDDKSSLSYARRTTILETVAKVRSCVVMLDLECDDLIAEMFRHFFRTIRDDHPEGVFSSMETIMTLVVEESEDISEDLLLPVLNVLKKENKEILPIACQLGERVIVNCASKLKAYLLQAVRSSGTSLDDYSKVVADVCQAQDEFDDPAVRDATISANKNMADGNNLGNAPSEKAVEVAMEEGMPPSEEVGSNAVGSPKTAMSNGILQKSNDNISADNDNSKKAALDTQEEKAAPDMQEEKAAPDTQEEKAASATQEEKAAPDTQDEKAEPSEIIADSVITEEPPKCKTEPEKSNNTSAVDYNSMEADLDMKDEKVEPSEMIPESVSTEEPVKSKTEPEKFNNNAAANDDSKEANLDTADEKAVPSETIADSVDSEELPELKIDPEKSNNTCAANDTLQKGELDTQGGNAEASETIAVSVGSKEPPKSKSKRKKSNKRKKKKPKSTRSSTKPLKPIVSDKITEVMDTQENQDNTKDVDNIQSVDFVHMTDAADGDEKPFDEKPSEATTITSLKTSDNERVETLSADETCPKRAGQVKDKEGSTQETASQDSEKESDTNKESDTVEATGSDSKLSKHCNKKASSASDQEESVPDATDDMKEGDNNVEGLDGNTVLDLAEETKVEGSQSANKKKQGQAKPTPARSRRKNPTKDGKKKAVGVPKSTPKASQDESDEEPVLKSSTKRKRSNVTKAHKPKIYGEELVGARVKVWWPDDKEFYKGVVKSFDSAEKKHKVLYDDGEVEVLNLKEETWRFVNLTEEHASDAHSPDEVADETPISKKAKTSGGLEAKSGKSVTAAKKSVASSSKSKSTPKSGSKQDISKISAKSEEASTKVVKSDKATKSGNKLLDDTSKSAKKPRVEDTATPKVSVKSKQDLSKGGSKSKSKTPKSEGKTSSGASAKVKAGTSTIHDETEDESSEPERTLEKLKSKPQSAPKSQKSSKKRKRAKGW